MSNKNIPTRQAIPLLVFGILWVLFIVWVFEINQNPIIKLLLILCLPIIWTLTDWKMSKDMPNLDDPHYIGDKAKALEDFKECGNCFEGSILLNGVKWKARCYSKELKANDIVQTKSLDGQVYVVEKI
jgi:membrane-bound ClpP family serine protease